MNDKTVDGEGRQQEREDISKERGVRNKRATNYQVFLPYAISRLCVCWEVPQENRRESTGREERDQQGGGDRRRQQQRKNRMERY